MSDYNRGLSKEDIERIGNEVVGKTFKDIGKTLSDGETSRLNKGSLGLLIEEQVFKYLPNNDSSPDFNKAGVELKVTPYKKNKNGTFAAKERLVLNIINYMEEYKHTFYTSSFWKKNKTLFIMFYLHNSEDIFDSTITNTLMFDYPKEDLEIIKRDWITIVDKIKDGKAHEISESDTLYLGACCKGDSKNALRQQPFSSMLAMQRAYCLKTSYMTQLLRTTILGKDYERISNYNDLSVKSFEQIIHEKVSKYIGKTQYELIDMFDVSLNSKNVNELIVGKMLNVKGKLSDVDEFIKANIKFKTVRVENDGNIIESMSFPAFRFTEIIQEDWYNSDLREMFETTKFAFAIFKKQNNEYVFLGLKFWNMPLSDLDNEVKKVWERTKELIAKGKIVKYITNGRYYTYFPTKSYNKVAHVRPHARDFNDRYELPVKDNLTSLTSYQKHCFWLNNDYIRRILYQYE